LLGGGRTAARPEATSTAAGVDACSPVAIIWGRAKLPPATRKARLAAANHSAVRSGGSRSSSSSGRDTLEKKDMPDPICAVSCPQAFLSYRVVEASA
jgi:hypothetical protein